MHSFSRVFLALGLAIVFPVWASTSQPLPTPEQATEAVRRSLDSATLPELDGSPGREAGDALMRSFVMGRLRSSVVTHVAGCVPDEQGAAINCIVQIDLGLGKMRYTQLPLIHQKGQWEAPAIASVLEKGDGAPVVPVPSPTVAQAQQAWREFARASQTPVEGEWCGTIAPIMPITIASIDTSCKLNRSNGTVSCEAQVIDYSVKLDESTKTVSKTMQFHLKGSAWQWGRSPE